MTSLRLAQGLIPGNTKRWAWPSGAVAAALALGVLGGRHPLTALLILIFAAGTYLAILQPFYGVLGLAILTPISSASKRGLLIPHLRISEALIIWLAPLVILFARRPVKKWGMLEWLGLAYALGTLVLGSFDLWRRGAPFNSSNVDTMLGPFLYLLLLRAARLGVSSERQLSFVIRGILLAAVPICVLALLQGFGVTWAQNLGHTLTGVNEGHLDRATGVFTNWQVLAGYLLTVGLVAVAVAAYKAQGIMSARAAASLSVLIGLALDPDSWRAGGLGGRQRGAPRDERPHPVDREACDRGTRGRRRSGCACLGRALPPRVREPPRSAEQRNRPQHRHGSHPQLDTAIPAGAIRAMGDRVRSRRPDRCDLEVH
jgi:hypothetical protein